jgi:ADP-heptose:LPS heptosyltransferase
MLFRLMPPSVAKIVISFLLRKRIDKSPAAFPGDLNRSGDILFILPEDRVEMVFQLENLFAILGRYKNSNITFLCPAAHASFVSALKKSQVVKYDPAQFTLYSAEFNKVIAEFSSRAFDICVVLEKRYTLAHLYIVGMSRAHLRIGWGDTGAYPFLNVRFIPAGRDNATLWERNLEVAKILNADADTTVRWGVPKTTAEEVAQLLSEHKLKKDPALICLDLVNLERNCGREWCEELLKALATPRKGRFYVFGGPEEENHSFKDLPFPVLPPMSIPRTAALIACTDLVITGAGALLGLAQISACDIIPVVTKEQAAAYCKKDERIMPAMFEAKADDKTAKAVLTGIRTLIERLPSNPNPKDVRSNHRAAPPTED